jgi:hypothetical protein
MENSLHINIANSSKLGLDYHQTTTTTTTKTTTTAQKVNQEDTTCLQDQDVHVSENV